MSLFYLPTGTVTTCVLANTCSPLSQGDTCRRRGDQPSADAARRDDPQAGLRVIYTAADRRARSEKVENIVREEMNNAGAIEVSMPVVQPADLWQESGRWEQYGPELLRFVDRGERPFVLGPTHEEVITDLIRNELSSTNSCR